jgi:predicted transcriptional regulator
MTTAMGTTIAISWGKFLWWIFLDTKRYWTGFNGKSPNSGERKMSKEAKVRVVTDGVDGFFNRARQHARKLDRGEKPEAELVIAFEDASEMMKVLLAERLRVLRASKKATPVFVLAGALKRNARAVSRDINLLESFGLLRTRYVPNPGHGRRRIVESTAKTYQLIATI